METLFNLNKWNNFLSVHNNTLLIIISIMSILSFFLAFVIYIKYTIKENEYKNSEIIWGFLCGLIAAIVSFVVFLAAIHGLIIVIGLLLMFLLCFVLAKLINYITNKPPRKTKIEITNLSDVVKGVYDEMLKINPNVRYEDIKASIEKKFSK